MSLRSPWMGCRIGVFTRAMAIEFGTRGSNRIREGIPRSVSWRPLLPRWAAPGRSRASRSHHIPGQVPAGRDGGRRPRARSRCGRCSSCDAGEE
jgi:hypothetical protein